ncbi:hypothetical protein, partial [Clostridioides difficile]
FTYHIVNIKPGQNRLFDWLRNKFTYHIVNIKQFIWGLDKNKVASFTYHIVNIKQSVFLLLLHYLQDLHTT